MQIFEGTKRTEQGKLSIYRFKVPLDSRMFGEGANVRVDIDARGVDNVRQNLTIAITIAVLIAIAVVIAVANWLAGSITRPVHILLKDMQVVARGSLDHQTKPHSSDEIGILAHEFNRMTENLKEAQSALVEQEKAEYELSIAREVQKQLLPAEPPLITGFDCADFYKGAKAVSGDYYDFIPLGNGLWGFIVADVSGKGIPGSMVMAVTRTIVRLISNRNQNRAAETLKETNRLIAKQIKRGMFVTAFYAILDERTGTLTYASAGHNPMVIYRAATRGCELATGKGIALGFNEGPIFDKTIEEHRTILNSGDVIVIYTDGFPEAMNAQNQEFGDDKFYQMIAQSGHLDPRSLIQKLVDGIAKHRGDAEQSDDLTLITVRRA
ncbi:MAG: SpoIIE family protein phosphatase [Planctomycetes bacterium]|nr:SpoIIE family protein phosphatase [Planctomycetota bacterium]